MLRDIGKGDDPQIDAITAVINQVAPDILVLTDFDFDGSGAALSAFAAQLDQPYAHQFSAVPNAGHQTGLDLDGDGFTGDARDAVGYGRFLGDGGLAILSHYPIQQDAVQDYSATLWRDIPDAALPMVNGTLFPTPDVFETLPASSTAHWSVPIDVGKGRITLLAFDATPPVFDGPEDFNGLRNAAELRLWTAVLNGHFGPTPANPIVIGNANADPFDGEGSQQVIHDLLHHRSLQDPRPVSRGAAQAADATHLGPAAQDTADWRGDVPGNLRVSYVLPSRDLAVVDAGVFWPAPDAPMAAMVIAAGSHRLVWVDIALPQ
ncbi:endonuclease/exonuclease/phosphatase family protein [Pseudooctadecabacter jejudonensis]|uniref:Endonuclease/exonuclease/phosphatase domain-containing protein n=1 Tax=Pseudooctadecabacter jejudonensis TaxID=1391910 RepID=A0A1Y5S207_9RHOB|nr:endonuclease/exonuclease/phosphatase family protein [Pseudooctadecabacter jejudonensis]SLN30738.1 hypothetical protein PSJ8397_01399 [Pseudooctadecabacter jejudonensis]